MRIKNGEDYFKAMYEQQISEYIKSNEKVLNAFGFMRDVEDLKLRLLYASRDVNSKQYYVSFQSDFINEMIKLTYQADSWYDIVENLKTTNVLVDVEKVMLHHVCEAYLIIHNKKEYGNEDFKKRFDNAIEKLLSIRNQLNAHKSIQALCSKHLINVAFKLVCKYRKRENVGRHVGSGKYVFEYNGKTYSTIQSCADDYNISKQAMHKRLKKLNII